MKLTIRALPEPARQAKCCLNNHFHFLKHTKSSLSWLGINQLYYAVIVAVYLPGAAHSSTWFPLFPSLSLRFVFHATSLPLLLCRFGRLSIHVVVIAAACGLATHRQQQQQLWCSCWKQTALFYLKYRRKHLPKRRPILTIDRPMITMKRIEISL